MTIVLLWCSLHEFTMEVNFIAWAIHISHIYQSMARRIDALLGDHNYEWVPS